MSNIEYAHHSSIKQMNRMNLVHQANLLHPVTTPLVNSIVKFTVNRISDDERGIMEGIISFALTIFL